MRQKNIFLGFLLLFLINSCGHTPQEIKTITPEKTDGIINLQMNHLGESVQFFGKWSAPRLGKEKKFFRTLITSGSGIRFDIPKKEDCILEITFCQDFPSLGIRINENEFSFSGQVLQKLISRHELSLEGNELSFLFTQAEKICVQQIKIFPKRFLRLKDEFRAKSDLLTPVKLDYYINPRKGSELKLSFSFKGIDSFSLNINVQSEENEKAYIEEIHRGKSIMIPMLDSTLHHIKIDIPETRSPFIRLLNSQLVSPQIENPRITKLKHLVKDMNVCLILLDAARADHMSCYGYQRKTTPYIDELAEKSFQFNNVFSEAAYTLASTGTLLTGLPPDFHGVVSAFFNRLKDDIITLPELFQKKNYFTAAITSNPYFGKTYNYDKGFSHFEELFLETDTVDAASFIEPFEKILNQSRDKPFFVYLHIREPHHPYKMPLPYFGKYNKEFSYPTEKFHKKSTRLYTEGAKQTSDFDFINDIYDENLTYADHITGKLLSILKRKQIFDNTITIIISDHGEGLGKHQIIGHNVNLYQGGIHIPLILFIPGSKFSAKKYDHPAITSDLTVTLCDLFELDYPYEKTTRGRNLFALPKKRTRICRSTILSNRFTGYMVESFPYRAQIFPGVDQIDFKLFNIQSDPDEKQPLTGIEFQRQSIFSFFKDFLKKSTARIHTIEKSSLSEKEKEALRSLGYIK